MDRYLSTTWSDDALPEWTCPDCNRAPLNLVAGSIHVGETAESRIAFGHPDWDPTWMVQRFSCLLRCATAPCAETVAVAGIVKQHSLISSTSGEVWYNVYEPLFVVPSPNYFLVPTECPYEIRQEIKQAFTLLWADVAAAANKIRSAVEALMNHFQVPKTYRGSGKRERLGLHKRLTVFGAKRPIEANALLAVKWIGNFGSHGDDLTRDNILDAFEILEHTLESLFANRERRVKRMAAAINKRRRPLTRRQRSRLGEPSRGA